MTVSVKVMRDNVDRMQGIWASLDHKMKSVMDWLCNPLHVLDSSNEREFSMNFTNPGGSDRGFTLKPDTVPSGQKVRVKKDPQGLAANSSASKLDILV